MLSAGRVLLLAAAGLFVAVPAAGEVRLTMANGLVSLDATGATLREILVEWEQVGRTRIFNADRVTGDPLTIRLEAVPEERALEILLRALNGYVAAPRATPVAGASRFDRIMIMPGIARPRSAAAPPPATPAGTDLLTQAPALPEPEPEDDERPVRVVPVPGARGTTFRGFPPATRPAAEEPAPPAPPVYGPRPVTPVGVPIPGMIVPAPEDTNPAATPSSGS